MLPKSFNTFGVLPEDYEVTFRELRESLLIQGPDLGKANWDPIWRRTLLDNTEILVRQLWQAGITTVHIDGSFVQSNPHPGDIDGCFECDFVDWNTGALEKRLNEAAPKKVWTWADENKRLVLGESKLLMWATYRVELYPYFAEFPMGMEIDDEFIPFPDAFRRIKKGSGFKGIVKLKRD